MSITGNAGFFSFDGYILTSGGNSLDISFSEIVILAGSSDHSVAAGVYAYVCDQVQTAVDVHNSGADGIDFAYCKHAVVTSGVIDLSTVMGIVFMSCNYARVGACTVQNSGGSGIYCDGAVTFSGIVAGAANTAYGVQLGDKSELILSATPTITGGSGNLMLGMAPAIVWATDLANNGDRVVHSETLSLVVNIIP